MSVKSLRAAVLAAAMLLLACTAWGAEVEASGDAVAAVWAPRQLHFVFQGFTAHYSCDGLQDKIRHVLTELGAERGFEVSVAGCSSPFGRPDPFPGVNIKMNVLQPADPRDREAQPLSARWRRVDLHLDKDPVWETSDCELLEQIRQKILPLFATRNVDFTSNCVPHQGFLGTHLSADLLVPDAKPAVAR
ncbi:MAG TPA: hypothetical protein VKQ31_09310 [Steroidobacteraceae bacterium]|nr:hypothetical protein [Steroidobacteraceae bacterium]